MYVFYEVGIVSAGFFNKKKPEESSVPVVVTAAAGNGKATGLSNVGEGDYVGVPTGRQR